MYKKQEKPFDEVLSYFSQPKNQRIVEERYPTIAPFTVREALKLENAEQRMVAFRCFEPEEIATNLKATRLDKKVISKTQIRWTKQLKPYEFKFEDTYELFKIDAATLGIKGWRWNDPSIYFVKCNCPSTDRQYYLYVPESAARNRDAIEAIAWTMRINGQHLTKEQYLHLLYAET